MLPRGSKIEAIAQQSTASRPKNSRNAAGQGVGFHAARGIHRVAPDVVSEFVRADDAGNDGTAVNPDARLKFQIGGFGNVIDRIEHAQRERGDAYRVVSCASGIPAATM